MDGGSDTFAQQLKFPLTAGHTAQYERTALESHFGKTKNSLTVLAFFKIITEIAKFAISVLFEWKLNHIKWPIFGPFCYTKTATSNSPPNAKATREHHTQATSFFAHARNLYAQRLRQLPSIS